MHTVNSLSCPTFRSSAWQSACGHHPLSLQRTHRADCQDPSSDWTSLSLAGRQEASFLLAAEK